MERSEERLSGSKNLALGLLDGAAASVPTSSEEMGLGATKVSRSGFGRDPNIAKIARDVYCHSVGGVCRADGSRRLVKAQRMQARRFNPHCGVSVTHEATYNFANFKSPVATPKIDSGRRSR